MTDPTTLEVMAGAILAVAFIAFLVRIFIDIVKG
jgi:hypothetical protein